MAINSDNKNFNVSECIEVVFDKYVAAVIDSSSVLEGAEFTEETEDPTNISPTRVRFYKGPNGKGPLQTLYNRGTSFHLDDFDDEEDGRTAEHNSYESLLFVKEKVADFLMEYGYRLVAVITCFVLLVLLLHTALNLHMGKSLLISICILLMALSVTFLLHDRRPGPSSLFLSSVMAVGDNKNAYSEIV